ncbi:MAG: sialate O-acetylesterase [Candidatus Latescibacter sp.]|nr:sialate O-acetylesterase [Candidatus Latescibacter sp.]
MYSYRQMIIKCLVIFVCTTPLHASVLLPSFLGHHMVIQRNAEYPVWGWADPGEKVTVTFHGQKLSAAAGADSLWKVSLKPMSAGGPYEMTVKGKNAVTLYNILIGDVWVLSGQSNMQWPVKYSANPEAEIAAGNHPKIRLFTVKKTAAADPLADCIGQWQECTFHSVGEFSGVGYYFGRELEKTLNIPIGLVLAAWGGTNIPTWMSRTALAADPETKYLLSGWEKIIDDKPGEMLLHYEAVSGWFEYCFVQMSRRQSYGDIPATPKGFDRSLWAPGWLYNAMVAPLTRFPVTGAVWYQGEGDSGRGYMYRTLLKTLINDWRAQWKKADLPFIVVQLANVNNPDKEPVDNGWAETREAQLMALSLPKTGLSVTLDLGVAEDVHYKNKQEAGRRTALAALKAAYGRDIVYSGPLYKSMTAEGGKIRLRFDCIGSGLAARSNEPLKGFAIAGADRKFVWADAKIDGNEVFVWSDKVTEPAAVRYAWSSNPVCNLYNKEGLPASSFRTDDWPGATFGKK